MCSSTSKCRRVLVVEDNASARRSMARLFTLNEVEVETAATVEEAMEKVDSWRPECMVLDLRLGEGRGEEVLRKIRTEQLPVRVAVVTGSASRGELESLKTLNPDMLLIKPIQFTTLLGWTDPKP